MKKITLISSLLIFILCGCNSDGRESSSTDIAATEETVSTEASVTDASATAAATSAASASVVTTAGTTASLPVETNESIEIIATAEIIETTEAADTDIYPDDIIPPAVQTPRVEGDRLSFNISNIYSEGEYYTLEISGVRMEGADDSSIDTTYIKGQLYGDFRLDLIKNDEIIDTLKINIPRQDRFLILESVLDNLSYGCEIISNRRMYSAGEFPDLIQLDFYMDEDPEIPQYARYFSVFGGRLREIPIYENGAETAPLGTHLEPVSAGVMSQYIVTARFTGYYGVMQYEFTFDVGNGILIREQVKFHG